MITIPDPIDIQWRERGADPWAQLAAIRAWLDQIDAGAWVSGVCDRVLAEDRLATALGRNAVEHPNGFDSFHLSSPLPDASDLPDYRVRLHIWWPENRHGIEDVHNHAWNFASCVLTGALRFITYTASSDPHAQRFYRYPYRFGTNGTYTSEHVERVRLSPTFDAVLSTHTRYSLEHREMHRIAPVGDQPAATLVVTGRFLRDGSDIFTEHPRHTHGARFPPDPLGATAVRERLARLREAITGPLPTK